MRVHAFKEDMAPQIILLMGLPAAGKSTFVKKSLSKYYNHRIPHVGGFQVLNSDVQLRRMQFERARRDYETLRGVDPVQWARYAAKMQYQSNDGSAVDFDLTPEEFQSLKFKDFWQRMYRPYYATYFGDRAKAKKATDELALKKIAKGDVVIIDSTGADSAKMLGYFEQGGAKGFTCSVVYLEINPDISIARDQYRGATEGRSVGAAVIRGYEPKLKAAYQVYRNSPLVDRMLHFRWVPAGPKEVVKGQYKLVNETKRYGAQPREAAARVGRTTKETAKMGSKIKREVVRALVQAGRKDLAVALIQPTAQIKALQGLGSETYRAGDKLNKAINRLEDELQGGIGDNWRRIKKMNDQMVGEAVVLGKLLDRVTQVGQELQDMIKNQG